jgi:hypothetical protein
MIPAHDNPPYRQTTLFENAAIAERAASCLVKTAQPAGRTRGALYAAAASRDYTVWTARLPKYYWTGSALTMTPVVSQCDRARPREAHRCRGAPCPSCNPVGVFDFVDNPERGEAAEFLRD